MSHRRRRLISPARLARAFALLHVAVARGNSPVVVQSESGFEGLEEPTVLYFPATNTFQTGDTFKNHVDEGGGLFRDILRNNYPTLGWWDGDGASAGNTDRQRSEPKGIVGLGHQQVGQTFEYSFDFRTNPGFTATGSFCHVFQLKATNGDDSPPLATISLYKSGAGILGRVDCFTDGTSGTPQNEIFPATFSYAAGQWTHFDIRITPCAQGQTTGGIQLSVNGGAFAGITNAAIDLQGSTDFRPKFGFYRGISTTNGVPAGDSWTEHRTITGYFGTSSVLTWSGGQNANTWDAGATANFNGSTFNTFDQVNFTGSTNTAVTLAGSLSPGFTYVNSAANYTFTGTGSLAGGSLRKDGTGTLTLATTNSYPGLTDVRGGTLYVTGSIGNNSLISLTGGTLKVGSAAALGSGAIPAQINGGTLDVNSFNVTAEPVQVQGSGAGGAGAIVNTGAAQTNALKTITLTGDTTFGGTARWDVRGSGASLSTSSQAFNLTKTGANQVSLVGADIDPALAAITINQGILAFQTSTTSMGNPTQPVTVGSGAVLNFYNTTAVMTKVATLSGGTIWAESGTGTQNTFAGPITLAGAGGTLDAGGALTGGTPNPAAVLTLAGPIAGAAPLTKSGPGTVTLAHAFTSPSPLTVTAGTLKLSPGGLNSLSIPTLTLGAGATLDLTDNPMTLANTPVSILRTYLQNHQLVSSLSDTTHALGYAPGLVVKLTLAGDANLDGTIDADDFALADKGFRSGAGVWWLGDFNYDGVVTGADYLLLDSTFAGEGHALSPDLLAARESQFGADYVTRLLSSVPEPSAFATLGLLSLAALRRKRDLRCLSRRAMQTTP